MRNLTNTDATYLNSNKFQRIIRQVMKYMEYTHNQITVSECDKVGKWTPCDLILREFLNNGCGSAKGFLGITANACAFCYGYILDNLDYFIDNDLINETGMNNSGYILWTEYGRQLV